MCRLDYRARIRYTTDQVRSLYRHPRWKMLRSQLLWESKFECLKCGLFSPTGSELHLHHIEPVRVNLNRFFDPSNIKVLCRSCHREEHRIRRKRNGVKLSRRYFPKLEISEARRRLQELLPTGVDHERDAISIINL